MVVDIALDPSRGVPVVPAEVHQCSGHVLDVEGAADVWEALQFLGGKGLMKQDTYPDAYHRHFSRFQGSKVTILEIGVLCGGSLQMWRTYFGSRSRIIGLHIDPECRKHAGEGIEIYIGDQADRVLLESLAEEAGPIDIVVDDGGHEK